ncbi:MAG: hypothetical protein H8D32_01240, partial [Dehalococcoidia bacterium]|nr:hypothetical protein [Dehalococcoidia bacterium]
VSGTYTHNAGRITGTVSGSTLIGTWSETPSYSPPNDAGGLQFTIASDCNSLTGVWRYGSSGDWSGDWNGTRIGVAPTPTPTPSPTPAGHKLVAYYPLDGDTTDHSGNGNHGTNHGGTFVSGVSGQALRLDGDDDVNCGQTLTGSFPSQVTVETWVNVERFPLPTDSDQVTELGRSNFDHIFYDGKDGNEFGLTVGQYGNAAFSVKPGAAHATWRNVGSLQKLTSNHWYHLVGVYNGNTIKIFVNGQLDNTTTVPQTQWEITLPGYYPTIGAYSGRSDKHRNYFQGIIDELRIYDYALTAGEIKANYDKLSLGGTAPTPTPTPTPTPSAGLVLHLPFDGSYNDASGYGNHGTPKGSMRFDNGVVGQQAAYFDGKSYVEIPDSNSLDLYGAFTFSVWLYKEDAGAGGFAVVLSKGDTAAADDNSPYALFHLNSGLSPTVRLTKDNRYTYVTSGARTDFKQWYHLGVTWDGRDVKFYVDGVLKDTQTWQGPLPNSAAKLLIGCDPPGATEYFRGMMDDLRIYNYALSNSQVQGVHSGAGPAPTPTPTPTPTGTALIAESRTVPPGGTVLVLVPVRLENAQNVGSLGFHLSYDPAVAQVTQVLKGSLPPTFTSNTQQPGLIIIGFATTEGVSGQKGSAVYVEFRAVGAEGSTCALTLSQIEATNTSGATVFVTPVNGVLTIAQLILGDINGDGKVDLLDALRALRMYVQIEAENLVLDMDNSGKVTPEDARLILLKLAAGTPAAGGGTGSGAQQVTSQRITTSQSGTVVDPSGAQIAVPHGAVAENSAGGEGEMLFAIKAGSVADFHLSGAPAYARVYEMGPSGFTFAHPVRITLPLPHGFNREKDLAIVCRYDHASGEWDVVGGRVNEAGDAVSVDVKHLSIFMPVIGGSIANLPTIGGSIANAPTIGGSIIDAPIIGGDIAFAPMIGGSIADVNILRPGGSDDSYRGQVQFKCALDHRFNVCISQVVNLKHYDGVPAWMQKEAAESGLLVGERFCPTCNWVPSGGTDAGYIGQYLPQGTYNFCVEQYAPFCGCPPATCELEGHYFLNNVTIGEPCTYPWYRTRTLDSSSNPQFGTSINLLPGPCPCYGTVTPSVGIGEVNVRLEWQGDCDLDLWVVDPAGEKIYYDKTTSTSGGELDLDNKCSDFKIGRPENIFWKSNPPQGEYKVYVDYFEDCGGAGTVAYTVRWLLHGNTYSKSGSISPPPIGDTKGDEVLITTFTY